MRRELHHAKAPEQKEQESCKLSNSCLNKESSHHHWAMKIRKCRDSVDPAAASALSFSDNGDTTPTISVVISKEKEDKF
ncbi:unnamed protein product [Brassica rapa]|uniref:Uncharacterized protein n=1 Tax=Brassica campestris TaxID=3711 RepID=A0A8D9HJ30_BRACM|nr:unnamed protein product [Brassica rapa]